MTDDNEDSVMPEPQALADLLRSVSFALEHGRASMVAFVARDQVKAIGRDFDRMGEVNKQVKALLEHLPPPEPMSPEREEKVRTMLAAVLDKRFGDGTQEAVDSAIHALADEQDKADSSSGSDLIAAERRRQVEAEGWTPGHDAEHDNDDLARAAACYATPAAERNLDLRNWAVGPNGSTPVPHEWPWAAKWWKPTPTDRVRELVKAGALIAAEIDRLQAGTNAS